MTYLGTLGFVFVLCEYGLLLKKPLSMNMREVIWAVRSHIEITPSLLGFTATQAATLVTLRSHSKVSDHLQLLIFVAATRFYHCLILDLASVDACIVRRYKTSQILQRVTHKSFKKSSKHSQGFPFIYGQVKLKP